MLSRSPSSLKEEEESQGGKEQYLQPVEDRERLDGL